MKLGSDEIPPVLTWDQGVFSRPSGGVSVYIHDAKSGVIFLWGWERCCLDLADFHAVLLKLFRFIFWCVGLLETLGFQAGCLYVRPSPDFVYVDILSGRFLRAASCREPTTVSLLHLTHTQIDTSCMNGGKKKQTGGCKPWRSERAAPPGPPPACCEPRAWPCSPGGLRGRLSPRLLRAGGGRALPQPLPGLPGAASRAAAGHWPRAVSLGEPGLREGRGGSGGRAEPRRAEGRGSGRGPGPRSVPLPPNGPSLPPPLGRIDPRPLLYAPGGAGASDGAGPREGWAGSSRGGCGERFLPTGSRSPSPSMEAIAKYDFKATADDELSFKRGDILKVSGGEGLGVHALALGFSAPLSGELLPVPLPSPQQLPGPFNRVPKCFLEPSLTSLKARDAVLLLC